MEGLMAHCGAQKIGRNALATLPVPNATPTHIPIPHIEIVHKLEETLALRHISILEEEYAVSPDGNRMFGLVVLDADFAVGRFALGLRNSHDKSMRFGLVAGRLPRLRLRQHGLHGRLQARGRSGCVAKIIIKRRSA